VVLYGHDTWFLALRDIHRLKLFENRLLRIIFGPKMDGLAGRLRDLHNKQLHIPAMYRVRKLLPFLYGYIHIKKEVSLPHPV
jgi:hypothetical protein